MTDLEQRGIDVIRGIAMDGPHAARSGHQGTAMALAPLAHVLWTRIMTYDPTRPSWPDRDRFVLSAGHASILQYAMLHLTGYPVSLDDLRDFRQWGSITPGEHLNSDTPESGNAPTSIWWIRPGSARMWHWLSTAALCTTSSHGKRY